MPSVFSACLCASAQQSVLLKMYRTSGFQTKLAAWRLAARGSALRVSCCSSGAWGGACVLAKGVNVLVDKISTFTAPSFLESYSNRQYAPPSSACGRPRVRISAYAWDTYDLIARHQGRCKRRPHISFVFYQNHFICGSQRGGLSLEFSSLREAGAVGPALPKCGGR